MLGVHAAVLSAEVEMYALDERVESIERPDAGLDNDKELIPRVRAETLAVLYGEVTKIIFRVALCRFFLSGIGFLVES